MIEPARLNIFGLLLAIGIIAAVTWWMTHHAPAPSVQTQTEIADQMYTTTDGKRHALYDFQGRDVIVHYWAAWCLPCVKEFPLLVERLRHDQEVVAIAISVDLQQEAMNAFLNKIPHSRNLGNLLIVHDPKRQLLFNGKAVTRYPESFVLDRDLNLKNHISGGVDWRRYDFGR